MTWRCAVDANIANQAKDCSAATEWEMGKPNQPQLHPWVEPATASVLITNGLTGTVSFDVTADVQAFLTGASPNYGWIVKKDVEGQPGHIELASRETGADGPRLALTVEGGDLTPPSVQTEGLFSDLEEDEIVGGPVVFEQLVSSADDGSGVQRVWVEQVGGGELAAADAPCSGGCPASFVVTLAIPAASLAEGTHSFVARALDAAGNVSETASWVATVEQPPGSEIDFDPPVSVADAVQWANDHGVRPVQLVSEIQAGDDIWTLYYVAPDDATDEEILQSTPEALLADLADEGVDLSAYYTASPPIVAMIVNNEVSPLALSQTDGQLRFATLRRANWGRSPELMRRSTASTPPGSPATCVAPWKPVDGYIVTRPSPWPYIVIPTVLEVPIRYVYQSFEWDAVSLTRLQCDDDVTYEPDAVYFRADGKYLGKAVGWMAATNLPASYLDTRASDSFVETAYTIGTSDADSLYALKAYHTLIRTSHGNSNSDLGVPRAQMGYHVGPNGLCPRFLVKWCIYSRKSDPASGRPNDIDLLNQVSNDPNDLASRYEHVVPGGDYWPPQEE